MKVELPAEQAGAGGGGLALVGHELGGREGGIVLFARAVTWSEGRKLANMREKGRGGEVLIWTLPMIISEWA